LSVELLESDNFEILSEDHVYLGDVDPDDDESVSFSLDLSSSSETIVLPLMLYYRDANNVVYSEEVDFEFDLAHKTNGGFPWGTIIFLIIIGVIGYFAWKKKWFKKKKKK